MKTLRVFFDYPGFPVWMYDEDDRLIENELPKEFQDDQEMVTLLETLGRTYEELFTNNSKEFSYHGFSTKEQQLEFVQMFRRACEMLKQKSEGLYHVKIDKLDIEWTDKLAAGEKVGPH